jgi:hypothetical protein
VIPANARKLPGVKGKLTLPIALMLVFALTRVPGMLPQNFSAAYALAFCAGVYFSGRMAWWLPLTVLLATDVGLNLFYYHTRILDGFMLFKWLAFVAIIAIGRMFKPQMSWARLLSGGLLGALLFYVVTNIASWLFDPGYAKTLAGLWQALTTGLPSYPSTLEFFRNTLLSGGLFTGLFVGAMKLCEAAEEQAEEAEEPEAAPEAEPEESQA